MKFTLTITDASPSELASILAALGAGSPHMPEVAISPTATMPPLPGAIPMPGAGNEGDDDEDAPADANAPAFDSTGLPWDERIHSSSKKTGNDGTWNKRRGGPKGDALTAIENELRARVAGGVAPNMPPAMPQVAQPVAVPQPMPAMPPAMPAAAPVMSMPPAQPMPAMQPVGIEGGQPGQVPAVAQVAAPQIVQPDPTDFQSFMVELGNKTGQLRDANGAPLINTDYLAALAQQIAQWSQRPNIIAITDLAQHPDLIPGAIHFMRTANPPRW